VAHGNYWNGVTLLKIYDTSNTGFGDGGVDYPYSLANGGNVSANIEDWGPITSRTDYRISAPIPFHPTDDDIITNTTSPDFGWTNPEHTLSDTVTYQLQVDNDTDFSSPEVDEVNIAEESINTYFRDTPALDTGVDYAWRVRANDTYNLSLWSTVFNFTILQAVSCTLLTEDIDFGQMCIYADQSKCDAEGKGSHINDTLDNHPPPYVVENDGTLIANGTIYSTTLWESVSIVPMPHKYYQFMLEENESGSYEWALNTSWVNMTNVSADAPLSFYGFDWNTSHNALNLHINLESPTDEPPGVKYSTTYVTCEQNEST
jgi:hypothetical protein